jgi:hypothetical protein
VAARERRGGDASHRRGARDASVRVPPITMRPPARTMRSGYGAGGAVAGALGVSFRGSPAVARAAAAPRCRGTIGGEIRRTGGWTGAAEEHSSSATARFAWVSEDLRERPTAGRPRRHSSTA